MWSIDSVEATNIISFIELDFEFTNGVALPIVGQNLDDIGQEANGAGKSALFEIVAMGLVGDSMRKVRVKENIRDDEDEATITLKLLNQSINSEMLITRIFRRTKTTVSDVYFNGERPKIKTSDSGELDTKEVNAFILEKIGITREDLFNYYLISTQNFVSFLNAPDTKKKEIISRFSNAAMVDATLEYVQTEYIDKFNEEIAAIDRKILTVQTTQDVYSNQLAELNDDEFEKLKAERIQRLNVNIENSKTAIKTTECEIETLRTEIKSLEEDIEIQNKLDTVIKNEIVSIKEDLVSQKELLTIHKEELEKDKKYLFNEKAKPIATIIDEQKNDKKDQEAVILKIGNEINHLKNRLSGEITCPSCEHEFFITEEEKETNIENLKTELMEKEHLLINEKELLDSIDNAISESKEDLEKAEAEVEKLLKDKKNEITQVDTKVFEIEGKIRVNETEENKVKNEIKRINDDIAPKNRSITRKEEEIKSENKSIESFKNLIVEEKTKTLDSKKKELQDKINVANEQFVEQQGLLTEKKDESEVYSGWLLNFKKFKTKLANNSVKTIESFTNFYLGKMNSNLRVQLNGYKTLASGEIREQISATIFRDGIERGSYGKFSAGERARIDIAVTSALQSIINSSSETGGLNMLFMDEVLDAVDTLGLKSIVSALQNLGITILIVTQNTVDQLGENCILVQKQNGQSKILMR